MEQDNGKGLVIGVIVVIFLAALFLVLGDTEKSVTEEDKVSLTEEYFKDPESVIGATSEVDLEKTEGNERLPEGFPIDTPVITENILQSLFIEQEDGGTQSIVFYESDSTVEEIHEVYISYLEERGYEIVTDQESIDGIINIEGVDESQSVLVRIDSSGEAIKEIFVSFVVE